MMTSLRIRDAVRGRVFRLLFSRSFGAWGRRTLIVAPIAIEGPAHIHLSDNVYVAAQTCLAAMPHTGAATCRLEIGEGSRLGRFNHIYASRRVSIGRQVLTANGVYISDNVHGYRDIEKAVLHQPIVQLRDVVIDDGSWIGHNACIIGASIGKHCIIGANAVVTRDVPDYCVVVGAPAVIIKRYDPTRGHWLATGPTGAFLDPIA
jgi:acetyltransferase-like isoleucine patch superfamily enzyme